MKKEWEKNGDQHFGEMKRKNCSWKYLSWCKVVMCSKDFYRNPMFVLWIKTIGMFLWTFFRWMPTNIILFLRRNFPLKQNQNHPCKNFSVENIRFYLISLATYLCSDFNLRTILIGTPMYIHVFLMKKKQFLVMISCSRFYFGFSIGRRIPFENSSIKK